MSFWGLAARPDFAATVIADQKGAVLSLLGTCAGTRAGPQFHFPEATLALDEVFLLGKLEHTWAKPFFGQKSVRLQRRE